MTDDEKLALLIKHAHLPEQNCKAIKKLEEKMGKSVLGMHKMLVTTVLAMVVLPTSAMYFVNKSAGDKVVNSNLQLTEQVRRSDSIKVEIITQYRIDNAVLRKQISNGGNNDG